MGDLQYFLMPASNPTLPNVGLHDKVFDFWMKEMRAAFSETTNDPGHLHEDFIRQDVVGAICSGDQVVATLLHSFASIYAKAPRTFRYMQNNYPELFFQRLKKMGVKNVMSVHYLAVHPDWRKDKQKIHLATLMLGLSQRVRDLRGADAVISVYRRDRKVHELAYSLGGDCVIENVSNHHTPCDLIVTLRSKPYQYPSEEVGQQIKHLWENRVDTFVSKIVPLRKAA
jgi:hypothetical protein